MPPDTIRRGGRQMVVHHAFEGATGELVPSKIDKKQVKKASFSPSHRQLLDLDPGMLCWALYTDLNKKFSEFVSENTPHLRRMEGVDLVWHQFKRPAQSIQLERVLNSEKIALTFSDMPSLLFFDSFSETKAAYLFKVEQSSDEATVSDFCFVFDQVRSHYVPPSLEVGTDKECVSRNLAALQNARLNFIHAIAPNSRFRQLKSIVGQNGNSVVNIISSVAKPFL
jgi:hypothetical protein